MQQIFQRGDRLQKKRKKNVGRLVAADVDGNGDAVGPESDAVETRNKEMAVMTI